MYTIQKYDFINVDTDEYMTPFGEKTLYQTLEQAKKAALNAHKKTEDYYLIEKIDDASFQLWHDEI